MGKRGRAHGFLLQALACGVTTLVTAFPPAKTEAEIAFASFPSSRLTAGTVTDPGDELWLDRFDEGWDFATSIVVSPDGDKVFVTGYSGTLDFRHFLTIAYEAKSGVRLWVARYGQPLRDINQAYSLEISPDGTRVFVTGVFYREGDDSSGYGTVAYDASNGTELWVARLDGGAAADIEVSPDGSRVIVTGSNGGDFATVGYSSASGAQLWVARYSGPGNGQDSAHSVVASPDGTKVFVSGASTGATGGLDYATVAYTATAGAPVQLWVARYDGPGNDRDVPHSMDMSPDGTRVFITGESYGASSDYATIAYEASSGATLWVTRYGGPHEDVASSLVVSPYGTTVFVTGHDSVGPGNQDRNYATLAYDVQSGAQLWARRYSRMLRGGDDRAFSIDVSPDGSEVFVTGTSFAQQVVAFATVAYDTSTGAALWASRYEDPSEDQAEASVIAASPDGTSVFVTGYVFSFPPDIITIAYSTT